MLKIDKIIVLEVNLLSDMKKMFEFIRGKLQWAKENQQIIKGGKKSMLSHSENAFTERALHILTW